MSKDLTQQIRRAARQWAYSTSLYRWSLAGEPPAELRARPADLWPGDPEKARWLCSVDHNWRYAPPIMHSFVWLRDLRALGGDQARLKARDMVRSWLESYQNWDAVAWRTDLIGQRLSHCIALYEFFAASAGEDFQQELLDSLMRQARHLSRRLPGGLHGVELLQTYQGLLFAGVTMAGHENWIEQALGGLKQEIGKQLLPDGAHISRSPAQTLVTLQVLLDIRNALAAAHYPLPEYIQHAIDRAGQAVRFFRYADRHMAVFQGAQEGGKDYIDAVFAQAQIRGRSLQELPCGGYQRMTQGRTSVVVDCGGPASPPYGQAAHASPLAFEMSYGRERLFVSCGAHPSEPAWQDALQATAAHNTLTINHRSTNEAGAAGACKGKVVAAREESKEAILIDCSHDFYVPLNGVVHRRRLFLSNSGTDLRGEDTLHCATGLVRPYEAALRFHIHPRVLVSLIREGTEALLRLPSGVGWRFHLIGGHLALENSIYCGQGSEIRKTKQLVIYGQISHNRHKFKWGLQREGAKS